jgi:hypothetical protein
MNELRFENNLQLTESEYVAAWGVVSPRRWSGKVRFVAITALGIACLFTPYTLLLGLILLGLAVLSLFTPIIVPGGARHRYRQLKYLHEALTYGVSDQKLWVKGANIDASVTWSMLYNWREVGDWLVLAPYAIPPVVLSLARLKEEGVYGRVRALAASHAQEFNTSGPKSN